MGRSENGRGIGCQGVCLNRKRAVVLMGRIDAADAAGDSGPFPRRVGKGAGKIFCRGGRIFLAANRASEDGGRRRTREREDQPCGARAWDFRRGISARTSVVARRLLRCFLRDTAPVNVRRMNRK